VLNVVDSHNAIQFMYRANGPTTRILPPLQKVGRSLHPGILTVKIIYDCADCGHNAYPYLKIQHEEKKISYTAFRCCFARNLLSFIRLNRTIRYNVKLRTLLQSYYVGMPLENPQHKLTHALAAMGSLTAAQLAVSSMDVLQVWSWLRPISNHK
jgi:hypothetical protein